MNGYSEGRASEGAYLVERDEDQWNGYDETRQNNCWRRWRKLAIENGCARVVLKLVPDVVFPSGSNTRPYVARVEPIIGDEDSPFKVQVRVSAVIDPHVYDDADDGRRLKLVQKAREAALAQTPPGGKYCILSGERPLTSWERR